MTASSVPELHDRISSGISEAGGGSSMTARESTVAPIALSRFTVSHDTGPPPASQVGAPLSSARPRLPTSPAANG